MGNLDPDSEQIAELPLQRGQVGIDRPLGVARRRATSAAAGAGPNLLRQMLGLADRQVPVDDLIGQLFRVWRSGDGPGMAHADIASQQH